MAGTLLITQLPVSVNSQHMRRLFSLFKKTVMASVVFIIYLPAMAQLSNGPDSLMLHKLYQEALINGHTDVNLRYLTARIGARISGSLQAQQAVEWSGKVLLQYNPDSVYLQPVMVPHWVRGAKEVSYYTYKGRQVIMNVCALGGSIGTNGMLTAGVVEVK
jgi:hypothetical protein